MPYIDKKQRERLDKRNKIGSKAITAGQLTYRLTKEIQGYLDYRSQTSGGINYDCLSTVLGCLDGAKIDFVRRIVQPYEERKQEENSDVWDIQGS